MVIARGLAADLGALHVLAVGHNAQLVHRVKDAALRGLQPVAHVGQRARDDHRHRVIEERILDLVGDVDLRDLLVGGERRAWCSAANRWGCVSSGIENVSQSKSLNIQIPHVERVVLDELAAGLDFLAHELGEHFLGLDGVGQINAQQLAPGRVHGRLKEFLGVHFAQALEALDRTSPRRPTSLTLARISGIENSGLTCSLSPSPSINSNSGLSCAE